MKPLITHFLLSVCVVVHSTEGVLDAGQAGRQAEQQADNPFQVFYKLSVALQLSWHTALSYKSLYRMASFAILLFLSLKGGANFLQRC